MTRARIFSQLAGNVTAGGGANISLATLGPFLTTANVIELTSLYFSNARVFANLQLASLNDLYDVTTANKSNGQALIWTGNIWAPGNVASGVSSTDVVPEGTTNLYFTNARARTAFTAGDPTIEVDWNLGTIRANVTAIANSASTTDAVSEGFVNKYFTNARVFANLQLASINDLYDVDLGYLANNDTLKYDIDSGKWIAAGPVGTSVYFAEYAGEANVVLQINNFTTDDLVQGANNLYLTQLTLSNVLANVSIDKLLDVNTQANLAVNRVLSWNGTQWVPADISLISGGTIQSSGTANVANFANTSGIANVAYVANIANLVLTLNNFTTSNLTEGVNLYYTNSRVVSAITPLLTTANIIDTNNLYFSNAKVNAVVQPFLTTANVKESSSNLYFTGQRVIDTLASNDVSVKNLTVNGNVIVTGNIATLNVGNVLISSKTITIAKDAQTRTDADGSGIFINGANARITYAETGDIISVNKNITVSGNILPSVSGIFNLGSRTQKFLSVYLGTQTIFLGNVSMSESPSGGLQAVNDAGNPTDGSFANLSAVQSITVDRVYGNVFPLSEFNSYIGGNATQFVSGTTGNLYVGIRKDADWNKFAGIRIAEVRDPDGNVRSDVIIYNDKENTNNSRARVSVLGNGNVEIDADFAIRGNLDVRNNITANGSILFTSGDYIQSGNAIPLTINGTRGINLLSSNVVAWQVTENSYDLVSANVGQGNVRTLGTVTATRFYGNVLANTIVTDGISANTARLGNITVGTALFDNVVSRIATFDSVTINTNLKVYGSVETYNSNNLSVSDNMIYLNNGSEENNPDIGIAFNYNDGIYRHGGFFRDASDGTFKVFDNYTLEPDANIFINTDHASFRLANIQSTNFIGNVTGFVTGQVSSIGNHSTTGLAEGTNQYFTNTRVLQAVNPLLTTANVIERTNQYFTNARVMANVSNMSINVFADVDITGVSLNKVLIWNGTSFVPGDAVANSVQFSFVANVANLVSSLSNFTTANLTEGTNLYFTNARVLTAVATGTVQGNITATETISANAIIANSIITGTGFGGSITGLDTLSTTTVSANIWTGLYTANVIESPTKLFFTNARILANVEQMSVNVLADVDISGITNNGILIWNGTKFIAGTIDSGTVANIANFAYFANVANTVVSISNFTTTDLNEGSNLYFTAQRVIDVVTPLLTSGNVVGSGSTEFANTAGVANTVVSISNFTTTDLNEGSNLYFTNTRVLTAVSTGTVQGNITATGTISTNAILANSIITGNLTAKGAVYYSNLTNVVKVYQYYNEAADSFDTIFL